LNVGWFSWRLQNRQNSPDSTTDTKCPQKVGQIDWTMRRAFGGFGYSKEKRHEIIFQGHSFAIARMLRPTVSEKFNESIGKYCISRLQIETETSTAGRVANRDGRIMDGRIIGGQLGVRGSRSRLTGRSQGFL
jgi:hypothetical protein